MGRQTAIINGQTYQFDDAFPPTMQELGDEGLLDSNQIVVRDRRDGRLEALSQNDRLEPDSFVITIPRFDWGC
jgi:hypothetical protein